MNSFSRQTFSEAMRYFRKQCKLSQTELTDQLSTSHKLYQNVSQSMISHWERGNVEPSLLRRIGIASFFSKDYVYEKSETAIISKALKNKDNLLAQQCLYNFTVDKQVVTHWDMLDDTSKQLISQGHSKIFSLPLEHVLNKMNIQRPQVLRLLHGGAIIGHAIFSIENGVFSLASYGALAEDVRIRLTKTLLELCIGCELHVVVHASSLECFLRDIYLEKTEQNGNVSFYRGHSTQLLNNPLSEPNLHTNSNFRCLRYLQQKGVGPF